MVGALLVGAITLAERYYPKGSNKHSQDEEPTKFGLPMSKKYGRVVATTAQGPLISGMPFLLSDETEVAPFLAVPYAKPPVGDLRWRPPQPPKEWDSKDVRSADKFPPMCMQIRGMFG